MFTKICTLLIAGCLTFSTSAFACTLFSATSQTLASFAVQLLPDNGFKVWVKYRPEPNMRGQEKTVSYSSSDLF